MKSPVIIDLFKAITLQVSTKMGKDVNFLHGHPKEITDTLAEMTKNPTASAKKYPLIALFQDFEEDKSTDFIRIRPQLIIATMTKNTLKAADRYEFTFKPELYPIYDNLLEVIAKCGYFNEATVKQIKHIKIDRLYWGRTGLYGSEKNIFNDFIDCIEIKELTLNVKPKSCI
jgi:hypothetical protein